MSNLYSQLSQIVNLILLLTTVILVVGFNNSAIAQLSSEDGNLKIQQLRAYQDACASGKPSDSYYIQNGVSGLLYPSKCSKYGTDVAEYKFVDPSGNERCTGKAVLSYVGGYINGVRNDGIIATWEIQDAVSGYNCSTIGEIYEIRMQ